MRHEYVIGNVYGMKKLIGFCNINGLNMAEVECVNCGRKSIVRPNSLFRDANRSCMCTRSNGNTTNNPRLYAIFSNMRYRCNTSTAPAYKNYGGRGIKVCDEWDCDGGYQNFEKWAINSGYKDSLTLDRIDENGMYCPSNCRWITKSENTSRANSSKRTQHRRADKGEYFAKYSDGTIVTFDNANKFAEEHGMSGELIRRSARSNTKYNGITFGYLVDLNSTEPQSTIESLVRE